MSDGTKLALNRQTIVCFWVEMRGRIVKQEQEFSYLREIILSVKRVEFVSDRIYKRSLF